MCLEVFVLTDAAFDGVDPRLIIDADVPSEILDCGEGQRQAVRTGAADTACGCGFLQDGEPPSHARLALGDCLTRHASVRPLLLIVRWSGMPLATADETIVAASRAHGIDYEAAWHRPRVIRVLPG